MFSLPLPVFSLTPFSFAVPSPPFYFLPFLVPAFFSPIVASPLTFDPLIFPSPPPLLFPFFFSFSFSPSLPRPACLSPLVQRALTWLPASCRPMYCPIQFVLHIFHPSCRFSFGPVLPGSNPPVLFLRLHLFCSIWAHSFSVHPLGSSRITTFPFPRSCPLLA